MYGGYRLYTASSPDRPLTAHLFYYVIRSLLVTRVCCALSRRLQRRSMASGNALQRWQVWSSARRRPAEHEDQRGGKGRGRYNLCQGTFSGNGMAHTPSRCCHASFMVYKYVVLSRKPTRAIQGLVTLSRLKVTVEPRRSAVRVWAKVAPNAYWYVVNVKPPS